MGKSENWTDEYLTAARQDGDPQADNLVATVLKHGQPSGGRLGYNVILDLADILIRNPELAVVEDCNVCHMLSEFDPALRRYYEPMEAPAWVDTEKIRIGQKIWEDFPLPVIGVLYAASLPACYLIKHGIPALYQTEKLKDHRYVFQRIYETGLMLEGVMERDGLRIIDDAPPTPEDLMVDALNELDPEGEWVARGPRMVRSAGDLPPGEGPSAEAVQRKVDDLQEARSNRRYIWGPGYIAAKKVRMLHASMRYMLLHKPQFSAHAVKGEPKTLAERIRLDAAEGKPSWPSDKLGVPVNQEDLAYTLLTFAYVIPVGLDHWGAGLTRQEKEGFLHLWKVVGHAMGLREDLLTDNWDEAELLYKKIQRLECGRSEAGVALTEAVMLFLESYLPKTLGINKLIGAGLIWDQMGPKLAAELLPEADAKRAASFAGGVVIGVVRCFARTYFFLYRKVVLRIPLLSRLMENLFERSADEIVQSWRDAYSRRPFYIPNDYNQWVRVQGADDAFLTRLQHWRERVFLGVIGPLLTFFVATVCFIAWIVLHVMDHSWAAAFGWTALGAFVATLLVSEAYLPHVYRTRPTLDSENQLPGSVDLS